MENEIASLKKRVIKAFGHGQERLEIKKRLKVLSTEDFGAIQHVQVCIPANIFPDVPTEGTATGSMVLRWMYECNEARNHSQLFRLMQVLRKTEPYTDTWSWDTAAQLCAEIAWELVLKTAEQAGTNTPPDPQERLSRYEESVKNIEQAVSNP